jgi:ribosome-binding protein aMBF1 (putative translation factor)
MQEDYERSDLEKWLRKRGMRTIDLAKKIGCTRQVLWKVKRGIEISPHIAEKIVDITQGCVLPPARRRGRHY